MRRDDRVKSQRLEAILSQHTAWEKRTLADLHAAGFKFRTIQSAYQRLLAQRSLAGFSQEQIDIAIRVLAKKEMK